MHLAAQNGRQNGWRLAPRLLLPFLLTSCSVAGRDSGTGSTPAASLTLEQQLAYVVARPVSEGSATVIDSLNNERMQGDLPPGLVWIDGGDEAAADQIVTWAASTGDVRVATFTIRSTSETSAATLTPTDGATGGEPLDVASVTRLIRPWPSGTTAGTTDTAPSPGAGEGGETGLRGDPLSLSRRIDEPRDPFAILLVTPEAIPALTGHPTRSASLSPAVLHGVIRRDLDWSGPIAVDLRVTLASTELADAAAALRAGADVVIPRSDRAALISALAAEINAGRLPADRIRDAADRVLARPRGEDAAPASTDDASADPAPTVRVVDFLSTVEATSVGMRSDRILAAMARVDEALQDSVMTAAAIAIGRHGRLVALRGFGSVDSAAVDPAETLFDLASLSKVVGSTSAAILLVDRGALDLDAPISTYLPEFSGGDKDRVTARHLLSHSSGLPAGLWVYGSANSPEQALRQIAQVDLVRPPGERAEYSDLGMILMAAAIERISGEPMDQLLAANLFGPLSMRRTMYLPPKVFQRQTVPTAARSERSYTLQGVVHDGNAFRLGGVAGHAGLFSTAADLAIFSQMVLAGGSFGDTRFFSEETLDRFRTRQEGTDGRALGWDTPDARSTAGRYFSNAAFGHTGFTGTSIWMDPDLDLFVVLLTNRTFTEADPDEIFDLRRDVHELVARSITDQTVRQRPGAR